MTTAEEPPIQPGEILDGKYRVDSILGAGGMGVVVAATHVQLQTKVAIKFLLPNVLNNPQIVERFLREGRAAVQIQSEHVARVSDVGTLSNGAPYLVMEYLEGQDLSDFVARTGPVPVTQAVGYLLQACEAIAEAHALGIVHRDLKPANLFLAKRNRRDPIVKVLDFGISKMADADSLALTKTAALMGSPYYMSPEQMKSARDADVRSDIWALGVILYELLAGAPPFQGGTLTEIVVQVTQGRTPRIRDSRPEVPQEIDQIIQCCLQKNPKDRYADVAKLAAALAPLGPPRSEVTLENISRMLGTRSIKPEVDTEFGMPQAQTMTQATASAWARSRSVSRMRRTPLFVGGAVVVAMGIAVVVWVLRASSTGGSASALPTAAIAAPVPTTLGSTVIPSNVAAGNPVADEVKSAQAVVQVSAAPSSQPSAVALVASVAAPSAPVRNDQARTAVPKPAKPPAPAAPASPPPVNRGLNMGMKE